MLNQQLENVILVNLEDLGRHLHADRIRLTSIAIDNDLHARSFRAGLKEERIDAKGKPWPVRSEE
jgi:hypothetical protein